MNLHSFKELSMTTYQANVYFRRKLKKKSRRMRFRVLGEAVKYFSIFEKHLFLL